KTDVLLTADSKSGPLASFTQEQFNQYMANYEATVGRTSRSFGGQQGALRRPNMRVTCFNCGLRGHYSDSCTNPPVSAYEQQQVRDTIRREREQQDRELFLHKTDRRQQPPASGANTTGLAPRSLLTRSNS